MFRLRPRAGIAAFKGARPDSLERPFLPRELVLPLESSRYDQAVPLVRPGDRVRAGQTLSKGEGQAFRPLLAPLDGTVISIGRRQVMPPPLRDGAPSIPVALSCIELGDLGDRPGVEARSAWRELDQEALRGRITIQGLEGEEGLPLDLELELLPSAAELLIIATDLAQERGVRASLLEQRPGELVEGVEILLGLHDFQSVTICCSPDQRKLAARLEGMLDRRIKTRVQLLKLGHPWDHPRLAAYASGMGLPDPLRTLSGQGILVCGSERLWRLGRMLSRDGLPAPGWLMFCRPQVNSVPWSAGNCRVLSFWPGTPLGQLLEHLEWEDAGPLRGEAPARIAIAGNLLEGSPWLDLDMPLLAGHRELHWLPKDWIGASREDACISCGQCLDICPLRLAPVDLKHLIDDQRLEEARQSGLEQCIDCGLCSWVCPSRIHLGHALRKGLYQLKELRDVRC